MFEITGDDIALLRDDDLRTLVGRLSEESVRKLGFSTSKVTWGGDQDATDGGLDVQVALPKRTRLSGFVPRAMTGFQVKKSDMSAGKILDEMRPPSKRRVAPKGRGAKQRSRKQQRNRLRPIIAELAAQGGAYIIVSAKGSTTGTALSNRVAAMKSALGPREQNLFVDFYDRGRLATWLREHPGLIPWVREKIGKSFTGWQPYGAWAYSPEGAADAYLLDDELRLKTASRDGAAGCTATEGLHRLRNLLREPRSIVRLVGLSGVGKTRFVQALFDDRRGQDALAPSLAIYTNLADGPDPPPISVAANLIAARTQRVLVVDNCGSDLHQRLGEICRAPDSLLSVITIEYDIRDDVPEGTSAFKLEPSSVDLVERLVKHRFPHISVVDAHTVAVIAGGNARVVLALAGTIGQSETIAGLNDKAVFHRLFFQGRPEDEELYRAAQACSLLYSFHAEETNDASELTRLGSLVGIDGRRMYTHVRELQRRDLVQRRGIWGAVLPHAIANRLAEEALENIPADLVQAGLVTTAPERVLRSFSRRLGYLHASREAQEIVRGWLKEGGLLGNVSNLNGLGQSMLENIAPVAPEAILLALERGIANANDDEARRYGTHYIQILGSLAYEVDLFDRSAALLLRLAVADDGERKNPSNARHRLEILFQLYLSGTLAPIAQRVRLMEPLISSGESRYRDIGVVILRALLEAWQFDSAGSFEFGARSRDYGYWPKTAADVRHWYCSVLQLTKMVATGNGPSAEPVRAALASAFRGLWSRTRLHAEIDDVCRAIAAGQFWPDGWRAVRQVLQYDVKAFTPEIAQRLRDLEQALAPKDLVEQVRAVVLPSSIMHSLDTIDESDDMGARIGQVETLARTLGIAVAGESTALETLLPDLVIGNGLRWHFGAGLAEGAQDAQELWDVLTVGFEKTAESDRRGLVLRGFLHGLHGRDPRHASRILDQTLTDPLLSVWFPVLQAAVPIGKEGAARLKRALQKRKAPAHFYEALAYGKATDSIPAPTLVAILKGIGKLQNGLHTSIEILHMQLYSDTDQKKPHHPALLAFGRDLLARMPFGNRNTQEDHRCGELSKVCFKGKAGAPLVEKLCRRLRAGVAKRETSAGYHNHLLLALVAEQPIAVLNGILAGGAKSRGQGIRLLLELQNFRQNPIDHIAPDAVIAWCKRQPKDRYCVIARVVNVSSRPTDKAPLEWSCTARELLKGAPDRLAVLREFVRQFGPLWIGTVIPVFEAHVKLLDEFSTDADPAVSTYTREEAARLRHEIAKLQQTDALNSRERDERFE